MDNPMLLTLHFFFLDPQCSSMSGFIVYEFGQIGIDNIEFMPNLINNEEFRQPEN